MNITESFLGEIDEVWKKDPGADVIHRARLAVLDYIGVVFAGSRFLGDKSGKLIESFAEGGEFYPLGAGCRGRGLGMSDAAFINGLYAHALDFDDGTNAGIIHLGSPVFSALFTMCERHEVSDERFIRSALTGYETAFTMAMTVQPRAKRLGYHATGICGVLGAALALSYMLGLDERTTKEAFSIAAVSAGGTLKVLEDGSELKPYNVAKSTMLACVAVQMAKAGFRGPDDVLGGNAGFIKQMTGEDGVELAPVLIDGTYAIQKAYIKPYAACRYCHPAIDIALMMRDEPGLESDRIDRVMIKTYELAVKKHDHTEIRGKGSAKMSIPYNFAAAYLTGKTGMGAFDDEVLESGEVKELTKRITVESDREMTEAFPRLDVAEVTVYDDKGRSWSKKVDLPKGEPENPLTEEEARAKYMDLMEYAGADRVRSSELADAVLEGKGPSELLELMRKEIK